jgi:dTMP kinase
MTRNDNDLNELKTYFKPIKYKNTFLISFEGIEGSGKSTQIKSFTEYLKSRGQSVHYFREPGGTKFGEKLRQAILESDSPIHPLAEANLFAASRAQLLSQKVIPLLEQENQIVILDRFIDSSLAYQGEARQLGMETILDLHKRYPLNLTPHCTFYLKIDLQTSLARQKARGDEKDYFEKENNSFYQNLINGYNNASELFKERISVIDGVNDQETVFTQIIEEFNKKVVSL